MAKRNAQEFLQETLIHFGPPADLINRFHLVVGHLQMAVNLEAEMSEGQRRYFHDIVLPHMLKREGYNYDKDTLPVATWINSCR